MGGATTGQPRCLVGAPFVIPDLETSDVQLKGPHAKVHRDPFHQHLILREDRVATVAPFAVASHYFTGRLTRAQPDAWSSRVMSRWRRST